MSGDQPELFPEILPPAGLRVLQSPACPRLCAMIRLVNIAADLLRPGNKKLGAASLVDCIRLFGGEFGNSARRTLALAAGSLPHARVPAALQQDTAEVKREMKRLAGLWAIRFARLSKLFASIAAQP